MTNYLCLGHRQISILILDAEIENSFVSYICVTNSSHRNTHGHKQGGKRTYTYKERNARTNTEMSAQTKTHRKTQRDKHTLEQEQTQRPRYRHKHTETNPHGTLYMKKQRHQHTMRGWKTEFSLHSRLFF